MSSIGYNPINPSPGSPIGNAMFSGNGVASLIAKWPMSALTAAKIAAAGNYRFIVPVVVGVGVPFVLFGAPVLDMDHIVGNVIGYTVGGVAFWASAELTDTAGLLAL